MTNSFCEYFHKNASLNKQYEICEKGININKSETRLFAALICHSTENATLVSGVFCFWARDQDDKS